MVELRQTTALLPVHCLRYNDACTVCCKLFHYCCHLFTVYIFVLQRKGIIVNRPLLISLFYIEGRFFLQVQVLGIFRARHY